MSLRSRLSSVVCRSVVVGGLVAMPTAVALAQAPADPNPGNLSLLGNVDFTNTYMFRGIRQDDTKIIVQPSAELDIALHSADAGVKSVSLNFGTWNSLHTRSEEHTSELQSH